MKTCAYPLCGRTADEGKPICWPCWSTESDFRRRETSCAHCGKPAVIKRVFDRKFKALCLSCGWIIHRAADRSKAFHTPHPLAEIEDSYAW